MPNFANFGTWKLNRVRRSGQITAGTSAVKTMTLQTSDYSSLEIDPSVIVRQANYAVVSSGLRDIYKCSLNRGASQEEVAVKSPRFSSLLSETDVAEINRNLDHEIGIWAILEHQYILRLYGTVEGFSPFRAFVSPWMSNGSLNSYLKCTDLMALDRLSMLKQIVEGLKYLHDNDVIHGNLTSNNILVAADGSPCLADFSLSNIKNKLESNLSFSSHTGSVRWAAPELIINKGHTVQCPTKFCDMYSLGCVMLEVLYGTRPYWRIKTASQVVVLKFANQEPIDSTLQIQPLIYMRQCWSIEPDTRPSVEDTLVFINGLFLRALDWPMFYSVHELPNEVITTYKHCGTVAGGLGDIWKCSWRENSETTEVSVILYVQSCNSHVSGCG